jgi:hypothetical protein
LRDTLPNLKSVSLIYSWFGDDLRAGSPARVKPKVEQTAATAQKCPGARAASGAGQAEDPGADRRAPGLWRHAGRRVGDRGDPGDQEGGQEVLFYPFL